MSKIELPIDTRFKVDGVELIVTNISESCCDCYFYDCFSCRLYNCSEHYRSDNESVIFKKVTS
ncbi:hypothetical protein M2451_002022 [Dysgonomonas sp. PFB1-18]|nr:hypothetical protein [Dysgonomonas sp. PF1-14]MDH6339198.1 hypothetical protein [Dysgonomonas sp. PF1-16]MDH6380697.1 hypothetical protein [Dysgonomonas sp. PFB1-18]MDH6398193.1 hypothetical protein [Dysgonomonas sp. PF1-23]